MQTIYNAKDILVNHLMPIRASISGDIYRDRRPAGSILEDIVVNTLPLTAYGYHQKGVLNVNVYVPFKTVNINGLIQHMPDNVRMKELAEIVLRQLNDQFGKNYNFYVEHIQDFEEQSEKASYINYRIKINLFNN